MISQHLSFAALLILASHVQAQTVQTGQTASGAFYRIEVPAGWQATDGLVIWNHGFDLEPIAALSHEDLGPLVDVQLAAGYAVAASSYSLPGWALFQTATDNQQLVEELENAFGVPDEILIHGASLGGIVTAQAIEQGDLGNVVGAMPFCGALAGSRVWDGALDLRLLYDYVCDGVPGAQIPGGAGGLPFPLDPDYDEIDMALAVEICLGVLTPIPTSGQQARLAELLALAGIPESFLLTDMGFATFALHDLVYDPAKLDGAAAMDNAGVDYGDSGVNAGVERVVSDPTARAFLGDHFTPSGDIGAVKIVSIHTDKDGLVIVENESEYASVVPPGNLTVGIIVEDDPTHCGFTEAETAAAWESLRAWVAGLPQPTAQDLQDVCNSLVLGGLAAGPCRYDPGFMVPDLDVRVRPRDVCVPDNHTLCLGDGGRFRATINWEDYVGGTGVGTVAALATQDTGSFWFFDPTNIEMVVKALDGRQNNGRLWIFFGSLTNVAFEMTVTDTETSLVKVYSNQLENSASVGDTTAF